MRQLTRKHQQQRRLFLEQLEVRRMMTVFVNVWIDTPGSATEGDYDSPGWITFERSSDDPEYTFTDTLTITFTAAPDDQFGATPAEEDEFILSDDSPVVMGAGIGTMPVSFISPNDDDPEPTESFIVTITSVSSSDSNMDYQIGANGIKHDIWDDGDVAVYPFEVFSGCQTCSTQPGIAQSQPNGPLPVNGIVFGDQHLGPGIVIGDQRRRQGNANGLVAGQPDVWTPGAAAQQAGSSSTVDAAWNPSITANTRFRTPGIVSGLSASGFSSHPVRYSDGTIQVVSTDLESSGFGMPWGITRLWTNGVGYARKNIVGEGMIVAQQPRLIQIGDDTMALITTGLDAQYFDVVGSLYYPRGFFQEQLTVESGDYLLTTTDGTQIRFFGFSSSLPAAQRGTFKSYRDAAGNTTSVTSHTALGQIAQVQRSYTSGSDTITESFDYTYVATGPSVYLVESATLSRRVNTGSWTVLREAEYEYYGVDEDHGNWRELKLVTIKDGANNVLDNTYYRYYKPSEAGGYTGGLKYVVYPQSYRRLVDAEGTDLDAIADEDLAPYADHYFEYDSFGRAVVEVAQGAGCSTCNGGQGRFEYAYTLGGNPDGYNIWTYKTVETLPDGNENIVYANYRGQVMLDIFRQGSNKWATFYRYDDDGRVEFRADASAVSGYDDSYLDLLHEDSGNFEYLRDDAGLITVFDYYTTTTAGASTPGGVDGYLDTVSVREGELGSDIPQQTTEYVIRGWGGNSTVLLGAQTVYSDEQGTAEITTSYAYTTFAGTAQIQSQVITDSASGSNTVFFDTFGRPIWMKDQNGFIHYAEYDGSTGAVTKTITDVDTSQTSDFANKPSGWTTPSGGGSHAITTYELDWQGRTTKETDANGNVTYIVYDDADHEIRVYSGWNTSTNTPTGPTIVMRQDADGGYSEVLTMSATPTVSSGRPTGAESISGLQSLTRTHLSTGGQAVSEDAYFSFSSLSYTPGSMGTEGTHYYQTEMAYDKRGRHAKTVRPDGTIYRTVFDGLGRPVSEWIGDNDTPATGVWSSTNPADMIKIKEYEYDNGNVGDSHLTGVSDAIGRETTMEYDFRGRQIEIVLPDPDGTGSLTSPVYAATYDNLGRPLTQTDPLGSVTSYAYDQGDREVTVTSADPDGAGPLTSSVFATTIDALGNVVLEVNPTGWFTTREYDGRGRLIKITQADPDGNGSLSPPVTEYEYDAVGNLRFITDPLGNVTEMEYDKANRLVELTSPDPDGASSLSALVTAYAYTAAGLLATVTAPGNRTTTYQYDALGRKTKVTAPDPDGTGGQAAAETEYEYDAASRLITVIDALDHETTYEYDLFDNVIGITAPDPDGTGSLTSPVTSYEFDNAGQLLEMTDPLSRETDYEYDGLGRRKKVIQPDPDGSGSLTRPETTFTFDAAGNLTQQIDPLGNRVAYEYDNLNRTVAEKRASGDLPTVSVSTTTQGSTGTNEVQVVTLSNATGGTFRLQFGSERTGTIAYNATASTVETALEALTGLDDVSVSGSAGGPFTITFQGAQAGTNVATLLPETTLLTNADLLATTRFEYDVAGRMLSLTDPVGNTTAWEYDNLGRTIEETNELNDSRTFKYDAVGNLTERVDRLGRKIVYEYDNVYRNTNEKWYSGTTLVRTLSFAYNNSGDLASASDPAATYSYGYDGLGRVTNEGQTITGLTPEVLYESVYDVLSRRIELQAVIGTDDDFQNTYTYDNLSRLTRLQQQDVSGGNAVADKRIDLAYDASGANTKIDRYADQSATEHVVSTHYSYDGMGRLTKLLHTEGPTAPGSGWGTDALAGYQYVYDAASRFTSIDSYVDGLTTYTHDNTDQLTAADHTGMTDESYTYDANGNRTMTGYTVGTNNQISTDGTYNYTYDDEGNRLTRTKISNGKKEEYTWDHRNRLIKITFKNSDNTVTKTVDQYYDVFNRWVLRCVEPNGASDIDTFFSYEGGQIALQFDDGGAASDLSHRYLWNPAVTDQLLADEAVTSLTSAGTMLWPLGDHLGTLRDLAEYNTGTDDTSIANHRRYDSYGNLISETHSAVDELFGYTGRALDESTGLQNNLNRWYDSMVGRWVSEDPIGFGGGDVNLLRYVANDPSNAVDPFGLDRYIINEGWGHIYIAVDIWTRQEDGSYVVTGQRRYDFKADPDALPCYLNVIVAGFYGYGKVLSEGWLPKEGTDDQFGSTPEEDLELIKILEEEIKNPPFYSAAAHNCAFWSAIHINAGIDPKRPRPAKHLPPKHVPRTKPQAPIPSPKHDPWPMPR